MSSLLCFRCFYAVPTFVNVKGMSSKMVIAKKGHLLPCSEPAFFFLFFLGGGAAVLDSPTLESYTSVIHNAAL